MKINLILKLNNFIRCFRDEAGFSLVESLVAVAILGVSLTALISNLSVGSLAVNLQNESTLAQQLAQTQMETIKAAAYDSTGASYTLISSPEGYAVSVNTDSAIYSNSHIQKITVNVAHDGVTVITLEDYKVDR